VRIFKTKLFARFARRERIADRALCGAVQRAERGLVGGGVIKQRIVRERQGRSGGYRTLLAFRSKTRAENTIANKILQEVQNEQDAK
jgi:hypothetical protein